MALISLKKLNKKIIIAGGGILVLIVTVTPGLYFYAKYQKAQKLLQNPAQVTEEETKALIDRVGTLIELPSDEIPTVATVSDVEKLKNQPFFTRAKNGDKLLIFNNAKKAILYDPLADKIVEVAQINIGQEQTATATDSSSLSPTLSKSQTLNVFLYNGTKTVGLTSGVEEQILAKAPTFKVVDKDYAQKRDYTTTLVIDLTGNKSQEAESLAKIVKGEISTLPTGEIKPENADILVIVGKDKE